MSSILIIDNHDSFVYNIIGLIREVSNYGIDIMKNDEIDFESLDLYDKIILSPGPGIPSEAGELLRLIDKTFASHSILGVCLGHQAIIEYFGGSLKIMDFPKHGHKSTLNIIDYNDRLMNNLPQKPIIGRYHSWVGDSIGDKLRISSYDEDGNIMSIYHPDYKINGLQFHPESIISNCGREIISNWLQ